MHAALRPKCTTVSFGLEGKILKARPDGVCKLIHTQELLQRHQQKWFDDLDAFRGPYGRVDATATEGLTAQLKRLAEGFEKAQTAASLQSARLHPESVGLMCRFLVCLIESEGKVQSQEFWKAFAPVLARRSESFRPPGVAETPIQRLCDRLASGNVDDALQAAISECLWPHVFALGRLLSPESLDRGLIAYSSALLQGKAQASGQLSTEELADPSVRALLWLYDALGRGSPPEMSGEVLTSWPAYAAMCSVLLRTGELRPLGVKIFEALAARLAASGDIFGAHLCYLLPGHRSLEAVDAPTSLIALLGVEHREPKNFPMLLDPLAMQLSEAYEYGLRCGDESGLCPTIQPFKLAHAMLLADIGLVDKARRYMTLLQAFVKAIPQNKLSDAFRASMRDFNDQLQPSQASAAEAPRVGKLVKDLFRGIAETTGLTVKPIAPPALAADDDEPAPAPSGFTATSMPPLPSMTGTAGAAHLPMAMPAQVNSVPFGAPPPLPFGSVRGDGFQAQPGPSYTVPQSSSLAQPGFGGWSPAPLQDDSGIFRAEIPDQQDLQEPAMQKRPSMMEEDPLLNAGKAVLGFGKSIFSAIKSGVSSEPKGGPGKDSQENTFYYDSASGRWRQRGVEDEPDISQYDPMTGKKLAPKVVEPPPPMMGSFPPMVGPPPGAPPSVGPPPASGGTGGGGNPYASGGRSIGSAALYVNPFTGVAATPAMPVSPSNRSVPYSEPPMGMVRTNPF